MDLNVKLNVDQPIEQDAWDFTITLNLVTYNYEEMIKQGIMSDVPEEHRAFLVDWLMRHTSQLNGKYRVDGLTLVQAPNVRDLINHVVRQATHEVLKEISEVMTLSLTYQLNNSSKLARLMGPPPPPPTTYSRPDTTS